MIWTCGTFNESALVEVIKNGILLPKKHGRLIDADKLPLNDIDNTNHGSNYIKNAPTIIEASSKED